MSQSISLWGATYSNVPAVKLPKQGGGTAQFDDTSDADATASDIASGKTAYVNGTKITGTGSGGGGVTDTVTTLPSGGDYHEIVGQAIAGTLTITDNGTYDVTNYASADVNVSGGGVTPEPKKQINFVDYDGTIVKSYTKVEWQSVSALPSNPSHSGLTAQGWNWTKNQIDAQLTAVPDDDVWVGQMYITQSGDTEIDVSMQDGRLSPIMTIAVNGTVTVDWGDNTTADTVTGSSLSTMQAPSHTYASAGDYTIKIHVVSGSFQFYGSGSSYFLLRKNTTANDNRVYANCVQAVRFGSGVTSIGQYSFYYCASLASVTIPNTITSIGLYAFYGCYALSSVTIPNAITSISQYSFYGCNALASIMIPSGVTSFGNYALASCTALKNVTIPSGVTSIGTYALQYCYSLASITIPSGVTSIGNYALSSCFALASITIPSSVTSIGNYAFQNCYGVAEYHIKPTTPPTLGTTVFQGIVSDCKIYVPSASLSTYQGASMWSTYSQYMVGE